ncbi:MAG: hypothetical protein E6Q97_35760 [Desulfurellales bacterium]|nr:MAG: hypothetical protein E6Q97_35760 [Desulfurellales bacterium]
MMDEREEAEYEDLSEKASNLAIENIDLKAKIEKLTEWADLMVDEFRRIRACPRVTEEIIGLCDRAMKESRYRIPMIRLFEERGEKLKDLECEVLNAKDQIARLKEQRDFWIMAFHDERVARISAHSAAEEIAVEGFRIIDGKVEEIGNG